MRQRRHLPSCESGRPQIAHVPTAGSRSIPVNASDSFNFGSCNRPIPWLIIPAPSLKPKRIRFLCEDLPFLDTSMSGSSRLPISGAMFMPSEFHRGNEVPDRHRTDQKLCSPLPSLALRDNADADAKAKYAGSRSALQRSARMNSSYLEDATGASCFMIVVKRGSLRSGSHSGFHRKSP